MFTGIIEGLGNIKSITKSGTNLVFRVESTISSQLKPDQSVSHNGVCLTVEKINDGMHQVTAIEETLKKTNLSSWKEGAIINLERCMPVNGRFDGHIVQGHVDTTATCITLREKEGSWEFDFLVDESFAPLIIEKGSVCLNGISLTIFNVTNTRFSVAVIPYTYLHTNMNQLTEGAKVNIEFDIVGKYINRISRIHSSRES